MLVPLGIGGRRCSGLGRGRSPRDDGRRHRRGDLVAVAAPSPPGRFGADVGAAIVFPVGRRGRRSSARASVDRSREAAPSRRGAGRGSRRALAAWRSSICVSGGDSHLTRSVLDAGGARRPRRRPRAPPRAVRARLRQVRRVAASSGSLLVGDRVAATVCRRDRRLVRGRPGGRAGLARRLRPVVGTSSSTTPAALLLMIGTGSSLGAALAFAWAQTPMEIRRTRVIPARRAGK